MRVNCSVTTCTHNKNNVCFANNVNVDQLGMSNSVGGTACASFVDSSTCSEFTNNVNMSDAPCDHIACKAEKCVYNHDNLCSADSITVSGGQVNSYAETDCATYTES